MEAKDEIFVKLFVRNISDTMLEMFERQCWKCMKYMKCNVEAEDEIFVKIIVRERLSIVRMLKTVSNAI